MKRFVDLTGQIVDDGEFEFAWYDTIVDRFETHSDCQTWDSWSKFTRDFEGSDIVRYWALYPKDTQKINGG